MPPADGHTFEKPFQAEAVLASARSIEAVRKLDAQSAALNAYARQARVAADRKSLYRIDPPLPVRHATEAEIMEAAEALDRGELLNPRLWMERMTVRGEA